jgi:hypothetical protein
MARVELVKPDQIDDSVVQAIFAWVTQMESAVPNHFYLELNFPEFMKAKLGATKALWEFASYNRLNIALDTDYDYRDIWREVAFGWQPGAGDTPGDNRRGLR